MAQGGQLRIGIRHLLQDRRGNRVDVVMERSGGRLDGERIRADEDFVHEDADGIEVGATIYLGARDLFGRHIGERAQQAARRRRRLQEPSHPEVHQFDAAVGAHQHVLWFQIPVHDAARMNVRESGEDLAQNAAHFSRSGGARRDG